MLTAGLAVIALLIGVSAWSAIRLEGVQFLHWFLGLVTGLYATYVLRNWDSEVPKWALTQLDRVLALGPDIINGAPFADTINQYIYWVLAALGVIVAIFVVEKAKPLVDPKGGKGKKGDGDGGKKKKTAVA